MFLFLYLDDQSSCYQKQLDAGLEAGFPAKTVWEKTSAILERLKLKTFGECAAELGLTRAYLAAKMKKILESKETKPEIKLMATRLLLNNLGEKTGDSARNVNITTPKALVIVGASEEKLAAMLDPQLPEEIPPRKEEIN